MLHNEFLGIQKLFGEKIKPNRAPTSFPIRLSTNCLGVPDINGGKPPKACTETDRQLQG